MRTAIFFYRIVPARITRAARLVQPRPVKSNVTVVSRLRRRFAVPINYATRRAASPEACTGLKHGVYFFHHHYCALSCEPLPPDIIFIIRRPITLPDSNAKNMVE